MRGLHRITRWKAPVQTAAQRLLLQRQAEFWLGKLDPARSLEEVRAVVVQVVQEARDVKTFVLRPNARWRGFSAGQHVAIEVEIDGTRTRRVYSLSSAPSEPRLAITVKRLPHGRVSSWLHDTVGPGHVLGLGPAAGDFVVPEPAPKKLLLLSAGSGITPIRAILRDLDARDAVFDVVLIHHARARDGVIFGRELESITARRAGLRLDFRLKDERGRGGFDEARLAELVPDFAERSTYLCGPHGLMNRVERMWEEAGASHRLHRESFGAPAADTARDYKARGACRVHLSRTRRTHVLPKGEPLLDSLERAGERPRSGCRIGICQTCTYRKRQGAVKNLITGSISSQSDEEILLCSSQPHSDLELDL